jgi:hypothetical protein
MKLTLVLLNILVMLTVAGCWVQVTPNDPPYDPVEATGGTGG